jgi:hypothetical protein
MRATRPILYAPAVCELDGPRITGPITSFRMLQTAIQTPLFTGLNVYFCPATVSKAITPAPDC